MAKHRAPDVAERAGVSALEALIHERVFFLASLRGQAVRDAMTQAFGPYWAENSRDRAGLDYDVDVQEVEDGRGLVVGYRAKVVLG